VDAGGGTAAEGAPVLVGESAAMAALREMADRVAAASASVLLSGESGCGKEVLARYLHARSPRAAGPFVAINCAALPDTLVEAELFGYDRGAFTGAVGAKPGLFEQANGGTLFLDEVTEIAPALQAKLLRALQERSTRRLGSVRSTRLDLRVIAASNLDPRAALREGRLRDDLYYRLRVLELRLPPLRERPEDLPPLCRHFFARLAAAGAHAFRDVGSEALEAMEAYAWPGNVRELENVAERATVLARPGDGDLLPLHLLPDEVRTGAPAPGGAPDGDARLDLAAATHRLRRRYVAEALHLSGGNKSEAARLLGISRRGLYDLMSEVGYKSVA
jgi:transcriptional regulator with PAS, ATPase and Fis domain